jgi:hypothetical protein
MSEDQTLSKPTTSEQPTDEGLDEMPCCASVFVLEQRFKPGWYLEWWGDECGGPYWTNDLAKAEKLTMDRAKYEKGMLREETLIIRHNEPVLAARLETTDTANK